MSSIYQDNEFDHSPGVRNSMNLPLLKGLNKRTTDYSEIVIFSKDIAIASA